MRFYVAVTNNDWFHHLAALPPDEVNFWRPRSQQDFDTIPVGAPLLFKLHHPFNFVVGGRFMLKHTLLPKIDGNDWEAEHVFAHSTGGTHAAENYLPAHTLCNNYRWYYGPEEFQWILKLGVWLRAHIESQTPIGKAAARQFISHDRRRARRRKARPPTE